MGESGPVLVICQTFWEFPNNTLADIYHTPIARSFNFWTIFLKTNLLLGNRFFLQKFGSTLNFTTLGRPLNSWCTSGQNKVVFPFTFSSKKCWHPANQPPKIIEMFVPQLQVRWCGMYHISKFDKMRKWYGGNVDGFELIARVVGELCEAAGGSSHRLIRRS